MAVKELTQAAQAAKLIRAELKKTFPTVKFGVKSRNFSMGDAVDVSWNLGPSTKQVDDIINKYQYGHFDGMTDMYEYSNSVDGMPQAKYVHSRRDFKSEEEIAQEKINEKLSWKDPKYIRMYDEGRTLYHQVGRELCVLMGVKFESLEQKLEECFAFAVNGFHSPSLMNLINVLTCDVVLMEGYHGARCEIGEGGKPIINSFQLF